MILFNLLFSEADSWLFLATNLSRFKSALAIPCLHKRICHSEVSLLKFLLFRHFNPGLNHFLASSKRKELACTGPKFVQEDMSQNSLPEAFMETIFEYWFTLGRMDSGIQTEGWKSMGCWWKQRFLLNMEIYLVPSRPKLGNGSVISFWHDCWTPLGPLFHRFGDLGPKGTSNPKHSNSRLDIPWCSIRGVWGTPYIFDFSATTLSINNWGHLCMGSWQWRAHRSLERHGTCWETEDKHNFGQKIFGSRVMSRSMLSQLG